MQGSTFREKFSMALSYLGLASLAVSICLFSIPAVLLGGNRSDLGNPWTFYLVFVAAGLLILIALGLLLYFLPKTWSRPFAIAFAVYGILIYLFDLFLPLEIGPIIDGDEIAEARPIAGIVQGLSAMVLFYLLRRIDVLKAGKLFWALSFSFAFISLFSLFENAVTAGKVSLATPETTTKEMLSGQAKFNIFHIVFDAYYGPAFRQSAEEGGVSLKSLDGFMYYVRARSNYYLTEPSYASFLSGQLFDPEKVSEQEWIARSSEDSLLLDLKTHGFKTHIYGALSRSPFRLADHQEIAQSPPLRLLLDYWLLRISPVALRSQILQNGSGPFSRLRKRAGDLRSLASYQQFQKILSDVIPKLSGSGNYYHFYFYPPHGPYQLDRNGSFVGRSSYREQHVLATKMLRDLVDALRKRGDFEDSLIVIHSDHGSTQGSKLALAGNRPKENSWLEGNLIFRNSAELEAQFSTLILIKKPAQCGPMKQSFVEKHDLVQTLDMRKYIGGFLNGKSADCEYPSTDSVHIFAGVASPLNTQKKLRFQQYHFENNADGSWTQHPQQRFRIR